MLRTTGRQMLLATILGLLTLLGLGAVVSWLFFSHITLRVALSPMDSDGQKPLAAFLRALTNENTRIRLQIVTTASALASAKAIDLGVADLAVVRSDMRASITAQTIALLRRDFVGLIVPQQSALEDIGGLAGKPIGVVQDVVDNTDLLDKIFVSYQILSKTTPRVLLSPQEAAVAIRQKRVAALVVVGPTGPGLLSDMVATVAKAGKGTPDILGIASAEAIAQHWPVLEAAEIAPGTFGGLAPQSEEPVATLVVTWRLVAHTALPKSVVGNLTRLVFTSKAKFITMIPQIGQIEAPEVDKSAVLPLHPGAAAYFEGEQPNLWERFESFLYVGTIVVSLLGSGITWVITTWGNTKQSPDQLQMQRLLAILRAAPSADPDTLDTLARDVESIVDWTLEGAAQQRISADQLHLLSLIITQVRQSLDAHQARLYMRRLPPC